MPKFEHKGSMIDPKDMPYDTPISEQPYGKWLPMMHVPFEDMPLEDVAQYMKVGIKAVYVNHFYTVYVRFAGSYDYFGEVLRLSIMTMDRSIRRDWREWEDIVQEILPGWTGVEVYPRPELVVDNGNIFHIWCFKRDLPFGFPERMVTIGGSGGTQRSWPEDRRPADLHDLDHDKPTAEQIAGSDARRRRLEEQQKEAMANIMAELKRRSGG